MVSSVSNTIFNKRQAKSQSALQTAEADGGEAQSHELIDSFLTFKRTGKATGKVIQYHGGTQIVESQVY